MFPLRGTSAQAIQQGCDLVGTFCILMFAYAVLVEPAQVLAWSASGVLLVASAATVLASTNWFRTFSFGNRRKRRDSTTVARQETLRNDEQRFRVVGRFRAYAVFLIVVGVWFTHRLVSEWNNIAAEEVLTWPWFYGLLASIIYIPFRWHEVRINGGDITFSGPLLERRLPLHRLFAVRVGGRQRQLLYFDFPTCRFILSNSIQRNEELMSVLEHHGSAIELE